MAARRGLLLINLGTPDAPDTASVRRYLREFLGDPRVIDLPAVPRWLLLEGVILPFRPRRSAAAYRKIWTEEGSPLLRHGRDLAEALGSRLAETHEVEVAMRYGNPSIGFGLDALVRRGVDGIDVMPLYPQYAASSWASSAAKLMEEATKRWDIPPLRLIPPFFDHPSFLDAMAELSRPFLEAPSEGEGEAPDHVLFSFHGIPERQLRKSDPSGAHCFSSGACCETAVGDVLRRCYRAQSFHTARALASRLGLSAERYSVAFQSRLGRTPWIRPFTDERIPELARAGVRHLAVIEPSFVADCLETLEEIGIRGKEQFLEAGGRALTLVPTLNAHPRWVEAVADIVRQATPGDVECPTSQTLADPRKDVVT